MDEELNKVSLLNQQFSKQDYEKGFNSFRLSEEYLLMQAKITHLEQKCAELELQLADRSEKYKIAMDKGLDVLNEKCKAYEKALKFYAEEENIKESRCETRIHNCDKDVDRGQTAREVLERYGK